MHKLGLSRGAPSPRTMSHGRGITLALVRRGYPLSRLRAWRKNPRRDWVAPRLRRAASRKSASDNLLGADGADGWAGGAALGGEVVGATCAERLMGPAIATVGNDYDWFGSAVSVAQEYGACYTINRTGAAPFSSSDNSTRHFIVGLTAKGGPS
jgi:hypothetical protein